MRRVLLLAVLVAPGLAVAQTSGQIIFTQGTNDIIRGEWISLTECQDATATVKLSWNTQLVGTPLPTSFPAGATYKIYASNKETTTTTCITDNAGTDTFARQIGTELTGQGQTVIDHSVKIADLLAARGTTTCTVTGDTPVFVCVQARDTAGTIVGVAKNDITLQITPPGKPTNVGAIPADDGALEISWDAPTGDPVAYDYRVTATSTVDTALHEKTDVGAESYTMTGLTNGVEYTINVFARSRAGNESVESDDLLATPVPVSDFWDVYTGLEGHREQGGCGTGSAGPVALLGVAGLLAALRRRA